MLSSSEEVTLTAVSALEDPAEAIVAVSFAEPFGLSLFELPLHAANKLTEERSAIKIVFDLMVYSLAGIQQIANANVSWFRGVCIPIYHSSAPLS